MIKWLNKWGWAIVGGIGFMVIFTGVGFAVAGYMDVMFILLIIGGLLAYLGILFDKPKRKYK